MDENIPMSEKAKGKQRAYPLNPSKQHQTKREIPISTPQSKIPLSIRFVDGTPDLKLECNATDTGSAIIKEIREKRPDIGNRQLKLIYAGRLVADHTPLSMLCQLQASIRNSEEQKMPTSTDSRLSGEASSASKHSAREAIWLHCAVGNVEEQNDPNTVPNAESDIPVAYERLTDAGLSQDDVQSIRTIFRRLMFGNSEAAALATNTGYAPTTAQFNHLESQWLDSITQPSIFEENEPTSSRSFLNYLLPSSVHASHARTTTQGLIFGFFFPFIAGSVVDMVLRPPAFFDGNVWPELKPDTSELSSIWQLQGDAPREEPDHAQNSSNERSDHAQEETMGTAARSDTASEEGEGNTENNALPRAEASMMCLDIAMDPQPSLVFSDGMLAAIRAGLILNIVFGFYIWLYIS
ncbi:hypothetical protein CPB86DRAFT_760340 [Serendipita vermifera]|nr:hypothetical protein CPB86DRAFT_760340 [Serendipita vermifera]